VPDETGLGRESKKQRALSLLKAELAGLGRPALLEEGRLLACFSDRAWRQAMAALGCSSYAARLASPTARRSARGKLGMATVCHFRHGHAAVLYVRLKGHSGPEIAGTVRHEALHVARPSYAHRRLDAALRRESSPSLKHR
jgi:hypothetical protein